MVTHSADALPLRGNDLAVDFVNTVADVRAGKGEYLLTALDLAHWGRHAGAIDVRELDLIAADIRKHPKRARNTYHQALRLRSTLTRIFVGNDSPEDLAALDRVRLKAARSRCVIESRSGYELAWKSPADLDLLLARILDAALALMTSGRVASVKQCDGQRCGWMFVDESRTRQRRWCSMQDCGNRAKVRRFRKRREAS